MKEDKIMTKQKLGIGMIGCGGISLRHFDSCNQLGSECVIRAVADIDLQKAEQRAAMVGGDVSVYQDYREMLKRDDIDVVGICTPPFAHKEPAVLALQAGKHVVVEKPMAGSLEECDEMIAAAEANNRKLAVVFQLRYLDDFSRIHEVLRSEEMGSIVFSQMNGYFWRGSNYYNIPWRGKFETECGGVTMNHSIHTLDLYLWLMDSTPVSVWADMDTINHDIEVEDVSMATIRFANGAVGQVNCSLNTVKSGYTMEFSSSANYVSYPFEVKAIQEDSNGFPKEDMEGTAALQKIATGAAAGGTGKHSNVYADLFSAIREDRQPLTNGSEGRRTLEVITAMYKSASTGEKVTLPIRKDDPWYTRQGILDRVKRSQRGISKS
jgi:predicted dehydrogenase